MTYAIRIVRARWMRYAAIVTSLRTGEHYLVQATSRRGAQRAARGLIATIEAREGAN